MLAVLIYYKLFHYLTLSKMSLKHVYMNIWEPLVGECLKSRKEPTNEMDKTTPAVIRINSYIEEMVVGHVPKNMSKIVFMFLSLPHYAL